MSKSQTREAPHGQPHRSVRSPSCPSPGVTPLCPHQGNTVPSLEVRSSQCPRCDTHEGRSPGTRLTLQSRVCPPAPLPRRGLSAIFPNTPASPFLLLSENICFEKRFFFLNENWKKDLLKSFSKPQKGRLNWKKNPRH